MSQSVRMLLVLSAITLASGVALGGLYQVTHQRAEDNILRFKKIPAVVDIDQKVNGKLDSDARSALKEKLLAEKKQVDVGGSEPLLVFVLQKAQKPFAVVMEGIGQGFGGPLGVMTGFALDTDEIVGIGITTMSETPGVGTRTRDATFTDQFAGMDKDAVIKVKKDGGVVDAVSGATISSRAVSEAVRGARETYLKNKAAIEQAVAQ